jgi:hypothetical protein
MVKLKPVDSVPVNGGMASSTDVINENGESLKRYQTDLPVKASSNQRNEPYRDAGRRGVLGL